MVESKERAASENGVTESLADQTLAFFDSVFSVVPSLYRPVDKEAQEADA